MTARYQHVTDTLRSQVARQVGDLIWDSPVGDDAQATTVVRRGSLATILAAVEACVTRHRAGRQRSELLAALTEIRAALLPATATPKTATETQTETRRPSQR